jgi:hypothetical protein
VISAAANSAVSAIKEEEEEAATCKLRPLLPRKLARLLCRNFLWLPGPQAAMMLKSRAALKAHWQQVQKQKSKKCLWFLIPTALFTHGQKWSSFTTQRPVMESWWARTGLKALQRWHHRFGDPSSAS